MRENTPAQSNGNDQLRESIDALIRSDLLDQDKVLILLTYSGEKPVSEIDFREEQRGGPKTTELKSILRGLNLYMRESVSLRAYFISRDPQLLEHAEDAYSTEDQKEYWRVTGTVHGFPQTAIDSFTTTRTRNTFTRVPPQIADTPLGRFYDRTVVFALSNDHWREELKVIEQWMESIRKIAPAYLAYIISDEWTMLKDREHPDQ